MKVNKQNIKLILVEPAGEINLGSVARLCKNYEIEELRLVSPRCQPLDVNARKMALKGIDILKNAKVYSTLLDAIDDCVRIIATCGRKDHGDIPLHSSESSLDWLIEGFCLKPVAIVFGREDRGLTNQELQLAQKVITLPSSQQYPSLNISHAVAIILNDLTRCINKPTQSIKEKINNPSTPKQINDCLIQAESLLLEIGFLQNHTAKSRISKIQAMFQRAEIREEEIALIRGILRQAKWFIDK
ncbi:MULTISPECIES: RNA methyltransferase [Prochlorococcus]|uniref:RNA methyltransferase n=1 Tax=Prochlorococcus TaxID=1218 RepID=UPI000567C668|nr:MULTISPECIES: RNA methyltransferase [Prochlorococcus]